MRQEITWKKTEPIIDRDKYDINVLLQTHHHTLNQQ